MSYVRFSSDSFRSDIYAWAGANEFVVTVATNRLVLPDDAEAPPLSLLVEDQDEWQRRDEAWRIVRDAAESVPIGLSRDGAYLTVDTEKEMYAAIVDLAAEGYSVPAYVLEEAAVSGRRET